MLTDYYLVLGIDRNATLEDIKRAYRKKVKLYHPDVSKLPDAHERFVEITEAYQFFLDNYLAKKTSQQSAVTPEPEETKPEWPYSDYAEFYRKWSEDYRKQAREKAETRASMRYKDFEKTPFYRTTQALLNFADYFALTLGVLIIVWAVIGVVTVGVKSGLGAVSIFAFGLLMVFYPAHKIWQRYSETKSGAGAPL
jgi:curved DNA-binding protein CbpA